LDPLLVLAMVELGLDEDEGHEEVELGTKKW